MSRRIRYLALLASLALVGVVLAVFLLQMMPSYQFSTSRDDAHKVMFSLESEDWTAKNRLLFFYWQGE
jgi:hypothetical protein